MKKTAVILFNLGGPDSLQAVRPFLFNLFNDPAIIRLPPPLRQFVASSISKRRDAIAQDIYAKIGGKSPILENTRAQAEVLEKKLSTKGEIKTFVAMRYWHPFVEQTAREVREFAPKQIILLPLYPQFSTTTSASSLASWRKAARKQKLDKLPTKTICCYPEEAGFISALADATRAAHKKAFPYGEPRILFSAHGLPEKIVKAGDPYQAQCEMTVAALVRALAIPDLDYTLCYQSRVGPLKWIGPATDDEVRRAGSDKRPIVIVPIAFVSEHSETLVEIDMEYRHLAQESGVPFYVYVPAVGTNPIFIDGLARLVRQADGSDSDCLSDKGARLCPPAFSGCCQKTISTKTAGG